MKNAQAYSKYRYQRINESTYWLNGAIQLYADDIGNNVDNITRVYCMLHSLNEAVTNKQTYTYVTKATILLLLLDGRSITHTRTHAIKNMDSAGVKIKFKLNNFIWLIDLRGGLYMWNVDLTVNFIKSLNLPYPMVLPIHYFTDWFLFTQSYNH